ncbi:MAG TPA: acetyl-CoA carboxylase biotin carboxyl carrier protein [Kiritimatiellia bacterium]|nr:acetyl-CoA carboxylase biotin carboxyl carrier protein [Kiritimatiellia bacterium]
MDVKNIKRIIELMSENDLSEFELAEEGFRITIRRPYAGAAPMVMGSIPAGYPAANYPVAAPVPVAGAAAPAAAPAGGEASAADAHLIPIKSPMVGTFYRSPSPESPSYMNVGDDVESEAVVCIIEAMKVMNEIKAEVNGVIKKILVENATPVEFGQPLFLVEPR